MAKDRKNRYQSLYIIIKQIKDCFPFILIFGVLFSFILFRIRLMRIVIGIDSKPMETIRITISPMTVKAM
jgi:hypothetical protein